MNTTIHTLRSVTPGLYTISDVEEYAEARGSRKGFFDTNYAVSFLEQEICYCKIPHSTLTYYLTSCKCMVLFSVQAFLG